MNEMKQNEVGALLMKIEEYKQLIEDAENALDAAVEDLEEALAEAAEEDPEAYSAPAGQRETNDNE